MTKSSDGRHKGWLQLNEHCNSLSPYARPEFIVEQAGSTAIDATAVGGERPASPCRSTRASTDAYPRRPILLSDAILPTTPVRRIWRIAAVSARQTPFAALPSVGNLAGEVIPS